MSTELNRRSFLSAAAAIAGAAAMTPLLSACGGSTVNVRREHQGGPQGGAAGLRAEQQAGQGRTFPGAGRCRRRDRPGLPQLPGLTRSATVSGVPGKGGSYTAVTPLWGTVPPAGNSFYQAMNKALGVNLTDQAGGREQLQHHHPDR